MAPVERSATSGFPSPAEDYEEERIDLNRELIPSPLSTFFMRARGNAMGQDGILDGDLLVVDRGVNARAGCVVVAVFEGRFIVRRLCQIPGSPTGLRLEASDGHTPPVPLEAGQDGGAELWGVVIHAVHHLAHPGQPHQRRRTLRRRADETREP
jgi:DNA polymerase V